MKATKHNLFIALLLCATVGFSQTRTKKITEAFKVKDDVIVEINAHDSDIKVEHWDRNEVHVEAILSIDGVSEEEADEYFDSWEIEALGNSNKVIIYSKPDFNGIAFDMDFGDFDIDIPEMNFEFDFEPVIAYALKFDSLNYPAPPEMPAVAMEVLKKIEWDQKAYEKDKEGYLKKWEKEQEKWEKEIEEKYEPMMEQYEKEMEKWAEEFEKKYEPKMKEYEAEMEKWEKDFEERIEPKLKKFEEEMEVKEKKIEKQAKELEKQIEAKQAKMDKMKKKITIKIPKGAKVDVDTKEGKIILPNNVKKA
ncbi:hypothetical protein [Urechidicola vernalis]|uniref:Uncharacterized protein n=1 Tax=Urechidicola vernalis TaxID=3075600 RepID=A0ABU2Y5K6_9FLAO|nr:hypothetical protein [Urechidicola sp. P050]MDT0552343.1 hypothetical protein [Urechidicola sp. P050]